MNKVFTLYLDDNQEWGWLSTYPYATGEIAIVATASPRDDGRWTTCVYGGPLDGYGEERQGMAADAHQDHARWVWRAAHAELTHPEYFRHWRPKPLRR